MMSVLFSTATELQYTIVRLSFITITIHTTSFPNYVFSWNKKYDSCSSVLPKRTHQKNLYEFVSNEVWMARVDSLKWILISYSEIFLSNSLMYGFNAPAGYFTDKFKLQMDLRFTRVPHLKIDVPWLTPGPQFWLQCGSCPWFSYSSGVNHHPTPWPFSWNIKFCLER